MNLTKTLGKIEITPEGAIIRGDLTFEEWKAAVSSLADVHRTYLRTVADLTTYGRKEYGDEMVAAAFKQLALPLGDVTGAALLAEIPKKLRRKYQLDDAVFAVISRGAKTEKDREKWSALAVEHKLGAKSLEYSMRLGKVVATREGHDVEFPELKLRGAEYKAKREAMNLPRKNLADSLGMTERALRDREDGLVHIPNEAFLALEALRTRQVVYDGDRNIARKGRP